jgi:hypothetical protein
MSNSSNLVKELRAIVDDEWAETGALAERGELDDLATLCASDDVNRLRAAKDETIVGVMRLAKVQVLMAKLQVLEGWFSCVCLPALPRKPGNRDAGKPKGHAKLLAACKEAAEWLRVLAKTLVGADAEAAAGTHERLVAAIAESERA